MPLFSGVKPTKAVLRDHFDPLYPDFNTDYPDQLRADEFLNEFAAYVRARDAHEGPDFELPSFVLLYLPDDHTGGTRPNLPRPVASVADNDLALGRVVDAVSHSGYWDDTAIFVLEDDAQDGADHVDAHRSIAFVISKYSAGSAAQAYVEHRFYTTVNMIHTMEMRLGLPPMNQNDAYAPVMGHLFSGPGSTGVQGGLSQSEERNDLRDQQAGSSGCCCFVEDGFFSSRRQQRGEAESRALAGSERIGTYAGGQTWGDRAGRGLGWASLSLQKLVTKIKIPTLFREERERRVGHPQS